MADDRAKLRLWDLTTKKLLGQLPPAHAAAISSLAFTRRGLLLASGDIAGNVRIWDFPAKKLLPAQLPPQNRRIAGIAFDYYGERVVTAAEEPCVRVWHVDSARPLAKLDLAAGAPTALRFSVDGNTLAACTTVGGLLLWDAETLRARALLQAEGEAAGQEGHAGEVLCATSSFSGRKLITGGADKTVRLWDTATRRLASTPYTLQHPVSCLTISPDGRWMAIGTGRHKTDVEPGELLLCQLGTGSKRPEPRLLQQGIAVAGAAFTRDGNLLAVCGVASDGARGTRQSVTLFNLSTGRSTAVPCERPQSLAISPDGAVLAVGRTSGEIELWRIEAIAAGPDARQARATVLAGHRGGVASLAFSPDGKTLASGGADNDAKVWEMATGEELLVLKHNGAVQAVRFSPDGRMLATADRDAVHGGVRLWRAAGDER